MNTMLLWTTHLWCLVCLWLTAIHTAKCNEAQADCVMNPSTGECVVQQADQQEEDAILDQKLEKAVKFRGFLQHMFGVVDDTHENGVTDWRTQERLIVSALLEYIDMDPFLFGKRLSKQDGNWLYDVYQRTTAMAPMEFFKVWDEHPPSMEEVNIIVTIDEEAIALSQQQDPTDGSYFVNQDMLLGKAFFPFRHRGFTAALLDTFCRVVLGPLKSVTYAIPSMEVLEEIAEYQPLIEVGAGSGYWSAVLQQLLNVDIEPHDAAPPKPPQDKSDENVYFYHSYTDILPGDCVSIFTEQDAKNRTLLIIWPNNPDNMDNHEEFHSEGLPPVWDKACLDAFVAAGGTRVIYVGERRENLHNLPDKPKEWGFCASRKFQTMLQEQFVLKNKMDIPVWYYSDDVTFWELKKENEE